MTVDFKDFYLNTPMQSYKYMKIAIANIPEEFILQYNLREIEYKGYVYVEIRKGMYGLPQAGRIAHDQLKKILIAHDYTPARFTPGLWENKANKLQFTLIVDDFGVKYTDKVQVHDLIKTLKKPTL